MNIIITRMAHSKTMIFSMILAMLGVVQASMGVFTAYLTPQGTGLLTLIIGIIVAMLRVATTQPLSEK